MQNLKEKAGLYFEKNALRYKEDYYLRSKIHPKWIRHQRILQLVEEYPELQKYDIHNNKGYGTKNHMDAIETYGITQWHRKSFSPCKGKSEILIE